MDKARRVSFSGSNPIKISWLPGTLWPAKLTITYFLGNKYNLCLNWVSNIDFIIKTLVWNAPPPSCYSCLSWTMNLQYFKFSQWIIKTSVLIHDHGHSFDSSYPYFGNHNIGFYLEKGTGTKNQSMNGSINCIHYFDRKYHLWIHIFHKTVMKLQSMGDVQLDSLFRSLDRCVNRGQIFCSGKWI